MPWIPYYKFAHMPDFVRYEVNATREVANCPVAAREYMNRVLRRDYSAEWKIRFQPAFDYTDPTEF